MKEVAKNNATLLWLICLLVSSVFLITQVIDIGNGSGLFLVCCFIISLSANPFLLGYSSSSEVARINRI